jgi:hypothetical protein
MISLPSVFFNNTTLYLPFCYLGALLHLPKECLLLSLAGTSCSGIIYVCVIRQRGCDVVMGLQAYGVAWSLLEIQYATDLEVWAVGAQLLTLGPQSWYMFSKDGGLTWRQGSPFVVRAATGTSRHFTPHRCTQSLNHY